MMMEGTSGSTVYQKILIDTLHEDDKLEKVITERTGCLQSAVSKHVGKLTGNVWQAKELQGPESKLLKIQRDFLFTSEQT